MFSMRFNARLDTPHHGPQQPFKNTGVIGDSSDRHPQYEGEVPLHWQQELHTQGFYVSPQVKIHTIQIWQAWRPCSGSSSAYHSVMIVLLRTSRIARLKCAGAPSFMYHICALTACGTFSSSFDRSSKTKSR
jgi:hypothetical protein